MRTIDRLQGARTSVDSYQETNILLNNSTRPKFFFTSFFAGPLIRPKTQSINQKIEVSRRRGAAQKGSLRA